MQLLSTIDCKIGDTTNKPVGDGGPSAVVQSTVALKQPVRVRLVRGSSFDPSPKANNNERDEVLLLQAGLEV